MFLKYHNRPAMILRDQVVGYDQLIAQVHRYARLFEKLSADKVAIFSENRPEWVYAFYAGWKNNAVVVPIDHMSAPDEVAYILKDSRPEVLFFSGATEKIMKEAVGKLDYSPALFNLDEIRTVPAKDDDQPLPEPDLNKTAVIIYTSGTTGSPKGVMLSYDNLLANIESVTRGVPIYTPERRVLVLLPLHHIFPLLGTMVAPLSVGGTLVFSPSMAADDIMATLQTHGVNIIVSVPRFYSLIRKGIRAKIDAHLATRALFKLAEAVNSYGFSRVLFRSVHQKFGGQIDYMVCGGAALDVEVGRDFKTLGFEVLEGFGMTEAAPMITFTRPGRVKVGSPGEAMPGVEIRIEDGEILARGRNIMQGYYHRPEETAEVLKDGWLHTGDLGYLDEDGFLHITGRKKEIIVLPNGKNINPGEIENKLMSLSDLISEVGVFMKDGILQAIIVPDEKVVRDRGIENLKDILRWEVLDVFNQSVSPYKKIMKFTLSHEPLPRTRLEKLKRFLLPQLAAGGQDDRRRKPEPDYPEYRILKEFLEGEKERPVAPDDHLEIDLALDSLDKVGLVTFINSTFGVALNEQDLADLTTVEKLADRVHRTKQKIDVEALDWGALLQEDVDLQLPKSWFTLNLLKNVARLFVRSYFRVNEKGVENLPEEPFILAPNHQSFFDGLFVAGYLTNKIMKNTYFYAKERYVRPGLLKIFAQHNNIIIMDISRDLKQSIQKLAAALARGKNIIIFPEGTRSHDGSLGHFKKTFAILSRELNVPVVPVAINGAFEALPRGTHIPRPFKRVEVTFLPPVYPDGRDYDAIVQETRQRISEYVHPVPEPGGTSG